MFDILFIFIVSVFYNNIVDDLFLNKYIGSIFKIKNIHYFTANLQMHFLCVSPSLLDGIHLKKLYENLLEPKYRQK